MTAGPPEYDFIVVGGGTAGCVLAARLSQDAAARVLLLEAGPADQSRTTTVPNAWPENLGSATEWGDLTTGQADTGPLPYPRGRVLGGSGAINAMAHIRGHRAVYDSWAEGGAAGWGFAGLLPYFQRSEDAPGRDPVLRGTAGPVRVGPVPPGERHPVARAFAAALHQAGQPLTADLSGADQEGVAWPDLAIAGGRRVSPADAYLWPVMTRPNLTIETTCRVTSLLLRHGHCEGVSYQHTGPGPVGEPSSGASGAAGSGLRTARATAEVILCAGAIGSPELLLRSGIGPADELRALGIGPVADLPGVGQNFQDHPLALVTYASAAPLPVSGYNHGETYTALRSELAGAYPDLHLFPILAPLAPPGCPPPAMGCNLVTSVVAPDSRGRLRLASADPQAAPLVDPGLLRDERDTRRLAAGLALIRAAAASSQFAPLGLTEMWPGRQVRTPAAIRGYLRSHISSYWHPAGTCRMGPDPGSGAVVDLQLRVHGVTGLRVADASVLPVIPNAPLNATVLAVAERAAELIAPPT
jgi:choline dehydrogenase